MALTNERRLHAVHATGANFNGIDVGGLMAANIFEGFGSTAMSPADGKAFPTVDRFNKMVRGTVQSQDWTEVLNLLAGTVGTYIFYEKESGAATYTKHTLTAPVVHSASINIPVRSMADCTWAFQCRPAANDDDFSDMWTKLPGEAAPTPGAIVRTVNIEAGEHDSDVINHITGLTININGGLAVAPGDGDLTNTGVDVIWGGQPISGSLTCQDLLASQLLLANSMADLILTLTTAGGVADKTLTIKNVLFLTNETASQAGPNYMGSTLNWMQSSPDGEVNLDITGTTSQIAITIA